jgi:hypothetical protein
MLEMETELKSVDGLVVKINTPSEAENNVPDLAIRVVGGYFYSTKDSQIHQTEGGIQYHYFDEAGQVHHYRQIHKILATSNKGRYPELPLLDPSEFRKAISGLLAEK